ncbi:MAG: translocation/assembly module TamB domain-containing protein [Armatimonadota bacterium]|nr:translocation/assembly module TamB domain-containing protein [Armatimonadota bacterium]
MRRPSFAAALILLLTGAGLVAWAASALPQRAREAAVAALSAVLGQPVRIGRVSGDPWRGIVLDDVALDGPAFTGGAPLLTARRVVVHLDVGILIAELWRRRHPAASIVQVLLEEPVLALARDAVGRWNLDRLGRLPAGPGGAPAFAGRVIVLHGTVRLADAHPLRPRVFTARFEDVNGTVEFSASPRVRLRASFVEVRDGRRVPGRLAGVHLATTGHLDLDLDVTDGDLAAWGGYVLATPGFRLAAGRFDATLHIVRSPQARGTATDLWGRVRVRGGAAHIPARGAVLQRVFGLLTVQNRRVALADLRGTLNGVPLRARGEISFAGEPYLDLAVHSSRADLEVLRRVFFPRGGLPLRGVASGSVRIIGAVSAPRLAGRVDAAAGEVARRQFARASGSFETYGSVVTVRDAAADAAGGSVQGEAWWRLGASQFQMVLRVADADATALGRWMPGEAPGMRGRITGHVVALGRPGGLEVAARARVVAPEVGATRLDALGGVFRYAGGVVYLEHATAEVGRAWASGHGTIGPDGTLALRAVAGGLDLAALPSVRLPADIAGTADFSGRVQGTLAAPEIAGDAQVRRGRVLGLALDHAAGRVHLRTGQVRLAQVAARAGRARYLADGTVSWAPSARVDLTLEAERAPAETLARLGGLPLEIRGSVDGRMRLTGPAARPAAEGRVTLRDAVVQDQSVDRAEAAFRWNGTRLVLNGAWLGRRSSRLELAGAIDRHAGFNLTLSARDLQLRDLALPPVAGARVDGSVSLTGQLRGPTHAPDVTLAVRSSDLVVNGIRFDDAAGEVGWGARTLRLAPLRLRRGAETYQMDGTVGFGPSPVIALTTQVSPGRLSTLLGLGNVRIRAPVDATITGVAEVQGPLGNPGARLNVTVDGGHIGEHRLVDGTVDLKLRDGIVSIDRFQLHPAQGTVAMRGRLHLRGDSQLEVAGADLPLDLLRPVLGLRRPLRGRWEFTLQLDGPLAAPEIGFSQEITAGGLEGATFDRLVANAFYRDGLLQVPQAFLVQDGHRLRAQGAIPFNPALLRFDDQRPMEFRFWLVDAHLGLLRLVSDRVEEAAGAVEGEVRVGGTVAAPEVSGGLRVRDGRVRISGLQTPIEAIRLDARFDGSAIQLAEASARLGTGTAQVEGALRLASVSGGGLALGAGEDAPLHVQGRNLRITIPPVMDALATGQLRVWGAVGDPRRPPTVTGQVTLSDGTVAVAAGPPGASVRAPLVFRTVRLEVGRDLAVQAGGLRFDLQPGGAVVLGGTLRAPTLDGAIGARDGKLVALGTTFDLVEATAVFQPHLGIVPHVTATAETQIGATHVTLAVRGVPPDALTLDLRSDPEMPRQEIVALLGRQAGMARLLEGDLEGALRAAISRRLFGGATGTVGRRLGLSELSLEYDFQGPLALRAGKLLAGRLYLTLEATFAEQTRYLWGLEYRFAPGWRITTRVGSDGSRETLLWYTVRF